MRSDEAIYFFRYWKDITALQCDPDEVLKRGCQGIEIHDL
jgi:hypothetical protein